MQIYNKQNTSLKIENKLTKNMYSFTTQHRKCT